MPLNWALDIGWAARVPLWSRWLECDIAAEHGGGGGNGGAGGQSGAGEDRNGGRIRVKGGGCFRPGGTDIGCAARVPLWSRWLGCDMAVERNGGEGVSNTCKGGAGGGRSGGRGRI